MVEPSKRARQGGTVALAAGVLGILYAPFHAAAFLASSLGRGSPPPVAWDEPFRAAFSPAFDFAGPDAVYVTFGRVAPLVVIGMAVGLWFVHAAQRHALGPFGIWSGRFLMIAMALLALGLAGEGFTPYVDEAFLVTLPAFFGTMVGSFLYGIATLRAGVVPRVRAWILLAGGLLVIPFTAPFGHIAMGLLGLFAAWIGLGAWLAFRPAVAAGTSGA